MDQETPAPGLTEQIVALLDQGRELLQMFLTPGWRQNQILIVLGLIALAWLMRLLTEARVQDWTRARDGWPKYRLRMLVQVRQRLALIYFVAGAWVVYAVMRQVTWPSRSYLIGIAATLATAWVVIAFLSRLVQNRTLRRLLTWGLWIYATLYALELIDDVTAFLDSVAFRSGELNISLLAVLKALLLVITLLVLARITTQAAGRSLNRNEDMSPSMRVLAIKAVQVLMYGFVIITGIRALGFDLTGLALLSGAVGVGIGFGLQKVVSNLVSGIIILLDRSIKPGDVISLGDTFGWIDSLGARYVSVVTRDGKEYLIPNEDLITSQVVNWSYTNKFVRLDINFGTSYGDDPHEVRRVAVAAARSVNRVLGHPTPPVCHITGFGDSSVDYILRFWITDPSDGLTNIKGNVFLALWDAFRENGISIPFPQREVRHLNDPARTGGGDGADKAAGAEKTTGGA
ncbi:mechanosensitive ion channel family protein [Antarcticimicrobium luteum]|uniref:Mechanosensitive ion channel n=1 Tax=Antarcticimicrobium luteum TaxID=2547397 RepID=A0A4V3AQU1_9RHOB|nr:mechanosensitive ion channel [Antarcticimicrobium luteum]